MSQTIGRFLTFFLFATSGEFLTNISSVPRVTSQRYCHLLSFNDSLRAVLLANRIRVLSYLLREPTLPAAPRSHPTMHNC